jgi:hypothetical protein
MPAARIVSYEIWRDCSTHESFNRDKFLMRFKGTDQMLLGADKQTILGHIDINELFTEEEWLSIKDETKKAMFRIDVLYGDVPKAGPEGLHKTSAVFRYDDRKEEPTRRSEYNTYT